MTTVIADNNSEIEWGKLAAVLELTRRNKDFLPDDCKLIAVDCKLIAVGYTLVAVGCKLVADSQDDKLAA